MVRTHRRIFALLLVFPLVVPSLAGAVKITSEQAGIGNFGQVNENYFRGAQPNEAAFHRLGTLGIKTIIDLQESPKPEEPGWVRGSGMEYFCIPLSGSHPATEAQTARFLELVTDSTKWPVYVHCAAGKHRTGEMTGIYRIAHDTWTADEAFDEMRKYGYYSFPNHGSLRDYVYKYYESYRTASAGKKSAGKVVATATGSASSPPPTPTGAPTSVVTSQ
jgi:protein tyrosine phosphatase (PTP) superfamily phosphohydrolase (DUF442 family)